MCISLDCLHLAAVACERPYSWFRFLSLEKETYGAVVLIKLDQAAWAGIHRSQMPSQSCKAASAVSNKQADVPPTLT